MKPLWIITQEAIYRHKILGIYKSREDALAGFQKYYEEIKASLISNNKYGWNDFDGHHNYQLYNVDYGEHIKRSSNSETLEYEKVHGEHAESYL